MDAMDSAQQRMVELESQVAWQEDLLDALNKTVAAQQKQIDQLEKVCRRLVEHHNDMRELLDSKQVTDEPPPHY